VPVPLVPVPVPVVPALLDDVDDECADASLPYVQEAVPMTWGKYPERASTTRPAAAAVADRACRMFGWFCTLVRSAASSGSTGRSWVAALASSAAVEGAAGNAPSDAAGSSEDCVDEPDAASPAGGGGVVEDEVAAAGAGGAAACMSTDAKVPTIFKFIIAEVPLSIILGRSLSSIRGGSLSFPTKGAQAQTIRRARMPGAMYSCRVSTLPILEGAARDLRDSSVSSVSSDGPPAEAAGSLARSRVTTRAARDHRLVGVAVVLFVVLLQAGSQYLSGREAARIIGHLGFLAFELPTQMIALSILYAALKRRHVGARSAVGITVLVAGTIGTGFGLILYALSQHYPTVLLRPWTNFTVYRGALYGFSQGQFHMGMWALAFAYPFAIDEARMKDLEADQLRSAAELARLRANLEPHFLLNTLNAIAGLVTEEPREARRLIGCLGDLLRDALHDDDELQTLHAQIGWLQRYAAILQARHAGALDFEWDVDGDTRSVLLPRLLLQPLVENAVKHGALQRSGGGKVVVRVHWTAGDKLECVVEDNGPGTSDGEVRPGAFGLRAVVRRVELKYPGARVALEPVVDGLNSGAIARVEIPRSALDTAAHGAGRSV